MNRSWITALTLATVAGSGAAFTGVLANSNDSPATVAALTPFDQSAYLRVEPQAPISTTTSYQVGAAGTATLTNGSGLLTIDNAVAGAGWTMTSASTPGTHLEVQFTDGTQVVTFAADLVGTDVVVSLSNVAVVPVTAPALVAAPETTAPALTTTTMSQPQPAAPPSSAAPAATQPPATSATTAPSGGGSDDGNGDDHEGESNDD